MKKKINIPSDLTAKFEASDPEIQKFIIALDAENLKSQDIIAELRAKNVTLQNRITILEKENSQYVNHDKSFLKNKKKAALMSDDELSDYLQKNLLKTKKST